MYEQTMNNDLTMTGGENPLLVGRYQVVRQLGTGGMGSVWLAEDRQLDNKLFAVKMLPSVLVSNKRAYRQLKDEAILAMKLVHPNIVQIRAFEENNGNPFLVMDYIEGQTLDDYLAEKGKLSEDETIRLLKPIAAALDYAHGEGVVHRDVKPANIMIRKDGHPYILDFGIAREIQETMTRVTGKLSSGTLLYMSPEQLNGAPPASSQDIYSFAAMVYECLNGEPPFSRGQIEHQILNNPPPPLPEGLRIRDSIMRCLAKTPQSRLRNCSDLFVRTTQSGRSNQYNCSLPWWKLRFRGVMGLLALYFGVGTILAGVGFGLYFICEKRIETAKKSAVERRQEEPERKAENEARQRDEEKQARERELTQQNEEDAFTVYVVQPGDYLAKISKKYNVPISSIKRLNPELESDALLIGQRIKLPGRIEIGDQIGSMTTAKSVEPYASYIGPVTDYVVKEGDSFAGIAITHGTTIKALKELNGDCDPRIRIGQTLKVPKKVARVDAKQRVDEATENFIAAYDGKNYDKAASLRFQADQNNPKVQTRLGWMFAFGHGVAKNGEEAIKLFHRAEQTDPLEAWYALSVIYFMGCGVAKDDSKAFEYCKKAAERGYCPAQWNLAVMYNNGKGVAKDEKEAVKWWRKAAKQGNLDAQRELKARNVEW